MDKKKLLVLIIFTIIVGTLAINFGFFSKTKYENILVDEDEWNEIISSRTIGVIDIDSISFNDNALYKDNSNKYYYSMVEGEKRRYNPIIKYKSLSRVKIAIKDEITDDAIEQNIPLEILFYTDDTYTIVNVYTTTLPLLSITYKTTDVSVSTQNDKIFEYRYIPNKTLTDKLDKLKNYQENISLDVTEVDLKKDQNMTIELFDNREGVQNRTVTSDGIFRYRGASTLYYPKKGYKINLKDGIDNLNMSLLGLRNDDDYVLYAAYNDSEKIRNVFASKLWYEGCSKDNSYNFDNGVEYKYVELFINGEYNGLYALGYPVDEKSVALEANEYMFKKYGWDHSELDTLNNVRDMLGYELVSNSSSISYDYLFNYYKKILSADKSNAKDIYNYMDTNNAIDIFLFYNLIQGIDNANDSTLKNTYMTIKGDGKVIYTPWDLDLTFGNVSTADNNVLTNGYSKEASFNVIFKISPVYKLIELGDNEINKLIYQKYTDLRENAWSDLNIMKILDSYENDIYNSGAYIRDMEKWSLGSYENPSLKLSKFKSYVIERLEYLDKYMEKYN